MAFHVMFCKPETGKHLFYFPVVTFLGLGQALHALFEHRVFGETEVLGDVADAVVPGDGDGALVRFFLTEDEAEQR